jgi:hypothetical protein
MSRLDDRFRDKRIAKNGIAERQRLKGIFNGNCNRTACQKPGATWFNTSTRAFYCEHCARDINRACEQFGEPKICFIVQYGDTR